LAQAGPRPFRERYPGRVVRAGVTSAAVLALLVAGSLHATLAPNVRGTIAVGDTGVVKCFPDEPCDPPIGASTTYVTFSRPGHLTVGVRVGEGALALHVTPAAYTIGLTPPPAGDVKPAAVRVPRTAAVRLHLTAQPTPAAPAQRA